MNQYALAIRDEAQKLIRRFELYAHDLADETTRRRRRTTASVARLRPIRPLYWAIQDGFDPYLVRARSERIGHAIGQSIRRREYVPRIPIEYLVPKAGGGLRKVSVFQVADNAVSRIVFRSLLEKNRSKMSSRSYAYRDDLTAHDAVQYIRSEFRQRDRMFIAEYDFSSYFDAISHDHIWETIEEQQFLMTASEKHVAQAFLTSQAVVIGGYGESSPAARSNGVPQGTSISLILANLAAWPLDRALERLGVGFARYADDTLIWSADYGQICAAADVLHEQSRLIGAPVNLLKSAGIRLLVAPGAPAEIEHTHHVDFVGHNLTLHSTGIKAETVMRIKKRLAELLYFNLVREPLRGTQDLGRLDGRVDRDYVVFIWQARRFLYGDLSEVELRRFQVDDVPLRRFKGMMSFYPLIDDTDALRDLDSWLASRTWMALRRRGLLLRKMGLTVLPPPHGMPANRLIKYRRRSATTGGTLDLRMPSLGRIATLLRRASAIHGPNQIGRVRQYGSYG